VLDRKFKCLVVFLEEIAWAIAAVVARALNTTMTATVNILSLLGVIIDYLEEYILSDL